MIKSIKRYQTRGFSAFQSDWQHYDGLKGRIINVNHAQHNVKGRYMGIAPCGGIQIKDVKTQKGHIFHSGEVSITQVK